MVSKLHVVKTTPRIAFTNTPYFCAEIFFPFIQEKEKENEKFIFRVAKTVASKLSRDDPPSKIERLVNATTMHLVKKMNASLEHVYDFETKLLAAVVEVRKRVFSANELYVGKMCTTISLSI